jgi:16S rRNA (cytosine967-C5)-methyltransferase
VTSVSSGAAPARPAPKARDLAFAVIRDVFGPGGRGAAESLDHHLQRSALDARDRGFATELAYGTIERRRWLDFQLAPYLGARAAKLPAMIGEILRMGTYQLRAMRVHPYAAVSESVALARRFGHPGTAGLVNAVLRRVSSEPERPVTEADFPGRDDLLGTRASLPTWLVRMWRDRFGDDRIEEICSGVNAPAAIGLAIDRRRAGVEEVRALLRDRGIAASPSAFASDVLVLDHTIATPALLDVLGDRAQLQGEAACFAADLLEPRAGERILDACCGRANKTLQLVGSTGGNATIVAVDVDERKVAQARARLTARGADEVDLRCADVRALPAGESFDAAIVDAPCSGIGIIGRQPEARWRKSADDGARLAPLQAEILAAVAERIVPGGRLVYAVCSSDRREAEAVVEPFLDAHAEFTRAVLPERYAPLASAAGDVVVAPGIAGRDGFYLAVLRKS